MFACSVLSCSMSSSKRLANNHGNCDIIAPKNKLLETANTAVAVGKLLSAGVSIATLCCIPVATPILTAASVASLATATYSGFRDRQAGGSWLGVLSGAVATAAFATCALTTAAEAGREVSQVYRLVVNGMNISSIVLSGIGVSKGISDVCKSNGDMELTAKEAVLLAGYLALLTQSMNNFGLASKIPTNA